MQCILFTLCTQPHLYAIYQNSLSHWNRDSASLPPMYYVDSCSAFYNRSYTFNITRLTYTQRTRPYPRLKFGPSELERQALLFALRSLPVKCQAIVKITGKYYIPGFASILGRFDPHATVVQTRKDTWLQKKARACSGYSMVASEVFQCPVKLLKMTLLKSRQYELMECSVGKIASNASRFSRLRIHTKTRRSDGSIISFL